MIPLQVFDPVYFVQLVIVKNLHVFIVEQVEIDLVSIIANANHKSTLDEEGSDFLVDW